ncbi:hypothetical protein HNY73_010628 [Argiope bruennichi]|uniref:Uncharacterized protein n=1 Tax=Argiope bruennichi TaxID=94029 RepID=A0A8T0F3K3_ARGBR|nr:hypothetical protein HNY73_010628 [Argiope bruennichi]
MDGNLVSNVSNEAENNEKRDLVQQDELSVIYDDDIAENFNSERFYSEIMRRIMEQNNEEANLVHADELSVIDAHDNEENFERINDEMFNRWNYEDYSSSSAYELSVVDEEESEESEDDSEIFYGGVLRRNLPFFMLPEREDVNECILLIGLIILAVFLAFIMRRVTG